MVVRRLEDAPTIAEMHVKQANEEWITADIVFLTDGRAFNIALPTAIYSDVKQQSEAIPLEFIGEDGIPRSYTLPDEEIYGVTVDSFYNHIRDISLYFHDETAARQAGIRTITHSAVAENLESGDVREITVQNTGGMTIQPLAKDW